MKIVIKRKGLYYADILAWLKNISEYTHTDFNRYEGPGWKFYSTINRNEYNIITGTVNIIEFDNPKLATLAALTFGQL